ncbi:MAG: hypothetical protein COB30_019400 [Ectothiorhodospiraceae bacterium]|nr:hypothetical protein [Ectothiorhodospiraceae bacterium]
MDWLTIVSVLFLAAMLLFLFPHMRNAMKNAPKGSNKDWLSFVMIIGVVGLFVMFLIQMV